MSSISMHTLDIPSQQRAIRERCFHPAGIFIEFKKEEIEQSIPDRFQKQVGMYSQQVAVKSEAQQMTYDVLNQFANRIANSILAELGEEPQPVALLIEHGAELIAPCLGILKAGKIFVPLDPSHPTERLTDILKDSQAALIVTNQQNSSLARKLGGTRCKLLDVDALDCSLPSENPNLSLTSEAPCLIVYTSGSTGQPKGVVHNHRALLYTTLSETNAFHICAKDRIILAHPISSIVGIKNYFYALLNGATLCPYDVKMKGLAHLSDWLAQQEITFCNLGATVYRQFVNTLTGAERFPQLRIIKTGGETIYRKDLEDYREYFPQDCIFASGMACTEISPIRVFFADKSTQIDSNTIPPGYAFEGIEVLLLDQHWSEVGVGQTGEIAVKSRYLSPGYWQRPDLTQAAFLPDPNGGEERIYLTGDLGRMLPDGCLEHLGRKDFQVKIRGYRVEVAEIEMALLELTSIKEAVVVAREFPAGDQRLAAYLVPATEPVPSIGELRNHLREKLPDYMVPSAFVFLDALPALPNGKLDRRGLPAPGSARPELESPYASPGTPVEESLVEVWAKVLGLDQVGIHDNFLELGGDSLLAGQVISRVISTFRVELPLRSLFEAPTVADMALAITQSQVNQAEPADIERMLAELEALSDTEAKQLLADGSPGIRGTSDE